MGTLINLLILALRAMRGDAPQAQEQPQAVQGKWQPALDWQ